MYDVIIVGAGPAGATLARLIGKRYKVLMLDKRQLIETSLRRTFEKCCGGLIAPDAQHMLATLGLGVPKDVLVGPQLFTVRTIDMQNSIERYYQRHYINVDREKFDQWMVSLIPDEVDIRCGCLFKRYEEEDDRFKVSYIQNGKEYVEYANMLVGADGASSVVRKQAFPAEAAPKLYTSIQEWLKFDNALPYFSSIFDSQITDFYSWTIPKEDCLLVGTAIPYGEDAWGKFNLLKEKMRNYNYKLGKSIKTKGAFIYRPVKLDQICTGRGRIALIGEAAGWISPSSAEGMSYSMRSALALAQSLESGLDDFIGNYKKNVASLKRNILVKNLKSPFMYNPIIRKAVMKSGLLSMEIKG
ncbi:MAG TPA: FAD-binding protein [Clostridia bacterium]|nr:FAD-binding protein [Clostridia bacterium]